MHHHRYISHFFFFICFADFFFERAMLKGDFFFVLFTLLKSNKGIYRFYNILHFFYVYAQIMYADKNILRKKRKFLIHIIRQGNYIT